MSSHTGTAHLDAIRRAGAGLILDPGDPLASARTFVQRLYVNDGHLTLRNQAKVFCQYTPKLNSYVDVEDAMVRAGIYSFLEKALRWDPKVEAIVEFKPTKAKVENVMDALRAHSILPAESAAPCWLDSESLFDPLDILPCSNGLLHLPTRELIAPSPRFFTKNGLEFAFDDTAPAPEHFLGFLNDLWPNDPESQDCLQEWLGYLLSSRTHLQKILMLVGPKRSGKGTIGRIIRRLVGDRNVCAPTLANMGQQFGLSTLIGKTVAIVGDARIGGRTDTAVVTERLLSISGEDALSVPRKFLDDWTVQLRTRFVIMTNELPRIEDASGALASRFVVITLRKSFYGHEDHGLFDRFVPEMPGILNWALEGYARLRARGHMVQPAAADGLIRDLEDLGSPTKEFLRECCEIGPGFEVSHQAIYDKWRSWCLTVGREHPGTIQTLGRNLRAAVPELDDTTRRESGGRSRYYVGIRLKDGDDE